MAFRVRQGANSKISVFNGFSWALSVVRSESYAGLPHTNLMCEHTRSQVYARTHELPTKLFFFGHS